jgi:hypothetical protein
LLPIGKQWVQEPPSFFANYFLPVIKDITLARNKERDEIKRQKMEILKEQIWELFPNYCQSIVNVDEALIKLMPSIKTGLEELNMSIIHSIARGFTKLTANLFTPNIFRT